jgi:hypothetical protein
LQQQQQTKHNPFSNNINNEDNNDNETIVTLRLSKKHYKTAYTLAHLLGYRSLDDYVSYMVVQNLEMEIIVVEFKTDVFNTAFSASGNTIIRLSPSSDSGV